MRILHDEPFTEDEKKQKIEEIKKNIKDSMCTILTAMRTVEPPCACADEEAERKRQWLLDQYTNPDFEYSTQFFDYVEDLWKDPGVVECFERSNEYQLIDCAKYFLEKVADVRREDFTPSQQARVIILSLIETPFFNHSFLLRTFCAPAC